MVPRRVGTQVRLAEGWGCCSPGIVLAARMSCAARAESFLVMGGLGASCTSWVAETLSGLREGVCGESDMSSAGFAEFAGLGVMIHPVASESEEEAVE